MYWYLGKIPHRFLTLFLSQFYSYGFSRGGPVSSWQTKASCHVSIFFCLFCPAQAQRGCVHLGHCWGTVWHQGPLRHTQLSVDCCQGGICFLPCRNIMVPGAVQRCPAFVTQIIMPLLKPKSGEMLSLHHPKIQLHTSLSQRSVWQDKHIQLQAEGSQSSSCRGKSMKGQRISSPPVKVRNLCGRLKPTE